MGKNKENSAAGMQKTSAYFRTVVAFHNLRDRARETAESWQERGLSDRLHDGWNNTRQAVTTKTKGLFKHPEDVRCEYIPEKYNYVFRPKSRWELILLSGTVCGIEFCYAAETAFVTPILLSLGLSIKFVTMIWCLSPLVGLFLTPILGSMSDSCESKLGRRRPFIIMYSIGILLGLILVPNGHHIGLALGDKINNGHSNTYPAIILNGTSEMGNTAHLNHIDDLNGTFPKGFYNKDFDDTSQKSIVNLNDEDLNNWKSTNVVDKKMQSGQNTSLAILETNIDPENIDTILDDGDAEIMGKNNKSENSTDAFFKLVEGNDATLDTNNKDNIKSPLNKNKYIRNIDYADSYPNFRFSRINMENPNREFEKVKHMQEKEFGMDEDEFSLLINEVNKNNNELLWESVPSNKYSRNIDDEDIHPSFRFRRMNFNDLNPESKNGKQLQKEKELFNDSSLETNSPPMQFKNAQQNINSRDIDGEDMYSKFSLDQTSKQNPPEIQNKNKDTHEKSGFILSPESKRSFSNQKESPADIQNDSLFPDDKETTSHIQTWSVVFTVIGTVLLDFCSDACQSPSRTYLLDVSIPSDHAAGLSTFTVMAGFGGAIGYAMGALHWETTFLGQVLGGQVNAVFMIVTVIFLVCLLTTVTSFPEIPLCVLQDPKMYKEYKEKFIMDYSSTSDGNELENINTKPKRYGSTNEGDIVDKDEVEANCSFVTEKKVKLVQITSTENDIKLKEKAFHENIPDGANNTVLTIPKSVVIDIVDELGCANERPTLKEYLKSIIHMPNSLRVLCLTNLFCWMSLVCYSLYFTDFVGECVFQGDPQAPEDSQDFKLYHNGVQFGCWGMALYSISCSIYSIFIESLVKKVGARAVYIGGQLVYSVGMVIMAITRHKVAVILLSPTAGIMYSTLFTMPYLLIAHYHCNNQFSNIKGSGNNNRGIGTDVAAVSSMVFLSQFILSLSMGSVIEAIGSNVVPVCAAAFLSTCGAVSATQVTYLNI